MSHQEEAHRLRKHLVAALQGGGAPMKRIHLLTDRLETTLEDNPERLARIFRSAFAVAANNKKNKPAEIFLGQLHARHSAQPESIPA